MLTVIALTPGASIEAEHEVPSMVTDLLINAAPKPPGSIQLISPPVFVCARAPWNVLQGAVRLHGLTSSPTPETQVRFGSACTSTGTARVMITTTAALNPVIDLRILRLLEAITHCRGIEQLTVNSES